MTCLVPQTGSGLHCGERACPDAELDRVQDRVHSAHWHESYREGDPCDQVLSLLLCSPTQVFTFGLYICINLLTDPNKSKYAFNWCAWVFFFHLNLIDLLVCVYMHKYNQTVSSEN